MRVSAVPLTLMSAATAGLAQTMTMSGGDATWYNPGLGSCGYSNTDADFIVAVDAQTIQSFPGAGTNPNLNPMCGRQMGVTTPSGLSVTVTVADTCPTVGCAVGSVDLSPAAFAVLAPLSVGRIHDITWTLV